LSSANRYGTDSIARLVPDGDDQAVTLRPDDQGRIRCDFRVGITGHRRLDDPAALVPAIREAMQLLRDLLPGHADSDVVLVVVSSLAEGADRLVARELLIEQTSRLEVILPVARTAYVEDFQDAESRKEFRSLLARASLVRQAPGRSTRQEAYEWAGRRVVDRCDALIAVWDGQPARGRGGTQQIVEYARNGEVPLAWVHATGDPRVTAELHQDSEDVRAMREAMRELSEYNESKIAATQLRARIQAQRGDLWLATVPTPSADALGQAREDAAAWLVPFLARADFLAERVHRRFRNLSTAMFAMAAAAVAVVAVQTNFFPRQDWLVSLEILLLVVLLAIPLLRSRMRLHERWTSYRFLAERLRSAYFLTLAGTGDRRQQTDQSASFSDPTVTWIERALSQIMASRPRVALTSSHVVALRTYLSKCWIGGQVKYHYDAARKSGRWELWLRRATACLFGITLISAVLHAIGLGPKLHLAAGLVVVSLSVPAAGAALHGIGTQREYRRNAQRGKRMVTQLTQLQYQMNKAESLAQIRQIAANVERSMREESNDWFGVMRFHDIELIT
jgi:hypothetical protein